jgi:ankyrin repeat protein
MRQHLRSVARGAFLPVVFGLTISPGLSSPADPPKAEGARAPGIESREFQSIWYRTPEKRGKIAAWLDSGDLTVGPESVSFEAKKFQLSIPTSSITRVAPADFRDDPAHTWILVEYNESGSAKAAAFMDGRMMKGNTGAVYEALRSALSAQAASTIAALHTTRVESLYYTNETVPKSVWKLVFVPDLEDALLQAYASGDPDDLYRFNIIMILNRRVAGVKDEKIRERIHECLLGAIQKDSFGWVKVEALDGLRRVGDEKEALAQAEVLMSSDKNAAIHEDVAKWVKGVVKVPPDDLMLQACTEMEAARFRAEGHKEKSQLMGQLVCQVAANVCKENLDQDACKNTLHDTDDYLRTTGSSMLLEAARHGRSDIVKTMIGLGTNVNSTYANGSTALMVAAAAGHVETVQALLSGGADASMMDKDGKTAIALAEMGAHSDVAEILRKHASAP